MKTIRLTKTAMRKNRFLLVEVLRQGPVGVRRFNRYRRLHPRYIPDFSGASLEGLNLAGINFRETNLIEANLAEVNLDGADLTGAFMYQAELHGAYLKRAKGIPQWLCEVEHKDFTL